MVCIRSLSASIAALALVTFMPAAMGAPVTMQAIVQVAANGGDLLQLQTVDTPEPAATEILIKVYAAAVNPVDWKRRPVGNTLPSGAVLPAIPGYDAAGVVDSVGSGVTAWKVGDAVVARVNGAYAQYVAVDVATVVAKPRPFTFEQAAGMPIAGMAAFGAVDAAQIRPGQRVAVIGAAGGAGSAAVDAARAKGAKIIASGHSSQAVWLKQRGVDEFVAYDKENVAARIQGVDAVLNMVDGQADTALAYVKRGGYLTSIAGGANAERCAAAGVTCVQIRATAPGRTLGDTLRDMVALANAGKYTVPVTKTFPLVEAAAAQQFARSGETVGKVILVVDAKSQQR
jgi:NADPH:quinone reductase-like Zn-dependent oxidoreductase